MSVYFVGLRRRRGDVGALCVSGRIVVGAAVLSGHLGDLCVVAFEVVVEGGLFGFEVGEVLCELLAGLFQGGAALPQEANEPDDPPLAASDPSNSAPRLPARQPRRGAPLPGARIGTDCFRQSTTVTTASQTTRDVRSRCCHGCCHHRQPSIQDHDGLPETPGQWHDQRVSTPRPP